MRRRPEGAGREGKGVRGFFQQHLERPFRVHHLFTESVEHGVRRLCQADRHTEVLALDASLNGSDDTAYGGHERVDDPDSVGSDGFDDGDVATPQGGEQLGTAERARSRRDEQLHRGMGREIQCRSPALVLHPGCKHRPVVVTDYRLPDGDALELIGDFHRVRPSVPIFVLTGFGSIELAVRAVKMGAHEFLTKPIDMNELVNQIREACSHVATERPSGPRRALPRQDGAPRSARMATIEDEVERLKDAECALLILGETGSGKTRLARRLHDASRRRHKPFVDLNCAGLAPDLVESELFGHERGAFTSAHTAKPGVFELADGGTLFLDEIGDISAAVQAKVLKSIEEKRFRRLGALRETQVDVRVIAATHHDLRDSVRTGAFRADLYYRLSTATIALPALRERPEDMMSLAREILSSLSASLGRAVPRLEPDAEAALLSHSWPGNIRELRNVMERAVHFLPRGSDAFGRVGSPFRRATHPRGAGRRGGAGAFDHDAG
jgi:DNA-binding NtrC family response regulator